MLTNIYDSDISNRALDAQIVADVDAALALAEQYLRDKYPEGMDLFCEGDSLVSVSEPTYQHARQQFSGALLQRRNRSDPSSLNSLSLGGEGV